MMDEVEVGLLAGDLRSLIRSTAPEKLAAMERLRSAAKVPEGTQPKVAATAILARIRDGIAKLQGEYHLTDEGRAFSADQVREVLLILLGLARSGRAVHARVKQAMEKLGISGVSTDTFHKGRREHELMAILARELLQEVVPNWPHRAFPRPVENPAPIVSVGRIEATLVLDEEGVPTQRKSAFTIRALRDLEELLVVASNEEDVTEIGNTVGCRVLDPSVRDAPSEITKQEGQTPVLLLVPALKVDQSWTFSYVTYYLTYEERTHSVVRFLQSSQGYTFDTQLWDGCGSFGCMPGLPFPLYGEPLPRLVLQVKAEHPVKVAHLAPESSLAFMDANPNGVYRRMFYGLGVSQQASLTWWTSANLPEWFG